MGKRSSAIYEFSTLLMLFALTLPLLNCAGVPLERPLIIRRTEPVQAEQPTPAIEKTYSKSLASLQLTGQGQSLLLNGNPDDAISMLEKSIGLDPKNGQSYYWLAEAWLQKGNPAQAEEFNRLADLYLENDPTWLMRVLDQRGRIYTAK